jgi:hypothetical protein
MVLAQWQTSKSGKLEKQVVWPNEAKSAAIVFPLRYGQPMVAGK